MYNTSIGKEKPLTKLMIECLIECHERELMKFFPCEATEKGAKCLVDRGLLIADFTIDEKGKRFMCVFLTTKGRHYLTSKI